MNWPMQVEAFEIEGHPAFLSRPNDAVSEPPTPWVWYAPVRPNTPGQEMKWLFEQLAAHGFAIAGIDVGESHGSATGVAIYQKLYDKLTGQRGLSARAALLPRSRGGLMLYNWAADHAEWVTCVAGIYPVCNLASYPGLLEASASHGLTVAQLRQRLAEVNPIERLAPLAAAGVPIFHIHGDNDKVVPLADNTAILQDRYTAWGGQMTVEVVAGGGHDVEPHWFQSQAMVDFLTERGKR